MTKGDALVSYLLKLGRDTTSVAMEKAEEANESDVADASDNPEANDGK